MSLAKYPELQKLSHRQKHALARELWAAAENEAPLSKKHQTTLDGRWADYKAGRTKAVPIAELERRLDAHIAKIKR